MNNSFEEIIVKAKIDHYIFKNYFHQGINEYNVHNSFKINKDGYMLPGLAFYNLFIDYKIHFVEKIRSSEFILYEITNEAANEIEQLLDFYIVEKNSKIEIFKKIIPKYLLIVKAVYEFFRKFSDYFEKIVKIFKLGQFLYDKG
jgi:hypothetical protein